VGITAHFFYKFLKLNTIKKLLSIAAVTVALVSLSSCKKDYTCTCTFVEVGEPNYETNLTIPNVSKKDAKTACDNFTTTYSVAGGTCELK